MADHHKPAQPAGAEGMSSTTEELLRLLSQQLRGADGAEGMLANPELEQLFGSLSKGLDQGVSDGALGIPLADPLTLEALVASLEQPPAPAVIPAVQAVGEAPVACPECGSANPAATRYCGMCGLGLRGEAPKVSGNGTKPALAEPPQLAQISGTTSSSLGFKMALLAGLVLALGGVAYQQRLWQIPQVAGFISNLRSAWTSPAPAKRPEPEVPASVTQSEPPPRREPAVVRTPALVVRPSKPSATVIRRNLPEPAQLDSAPLPQEIPLPPLPPAPAAESAGPQPAGEAPATAPGTPVAQPAPPPQLVPGELIFKVKPQYPPAARAARIQGSVVMHAVIGTDGTIQELRLIRGNPLLVNAAMEAVKKWRYRPYSLDGTPVEGETDITVSFQEE